MAETEGFHYTRSQNNTVYNGFLPGPTLQANITLLLQLYQAAVNY